MIYKTILFLLFICFNISAQDTIFKRDLTVVCAKVEEVTNLTVSYKRCEIIDGPMYVSNISDIYKIKYKNGSVDTFQVSAIQTIAKEPEVVYSKPYSVSNPEQIQKIYKRNTYIYQSIPISHKNIFMISFEKNRIWNDRELSREIMLAKDSQKKTILLWIWWSGNRSCWFNRSFKNATKYK